MATGTHLGSRLSPPIATAADVNVIYKVFTVFQALCQGCYRHFINSSSQLYVEANPIIVPV